MRINEADLRSILGCARIAGKAILEVYEANDFEVENKSDASPITEADRQSNRIICDFLDHNFPDIPIISEENKDIPWETRRHFSECWLVDPLDGTKEFVKRNGEFTVNIALIREGYPVLGVVYVPVTDTMYWAGERVLADRADDAEKEDSADAYGAWKQVGQHTPVGLRCKRFSMEDEGLRVVASRSHLNDATKEFIEQLNTPVLTSRGSSLKFLMIAEGDAELYPRIAPTMEWDTAAAQCIVEQAGGEVVVFETGERMRYNKERLRNPNFIACAARVV